MRVSKLATAQRVEKFNNQRFKIISYGYSNDYPQKCLEIMQSSGTGTHCVNTYAKFVSGQSFVNTILEKQKFGTQTGGELRRKLGYDFACFQGFAVHVGYNALLEPVEFNYVPFENCRLGAEKKDSNNFVFNNTIHIHPDWGGRTKAAKPEEVSILDIYNPDKSVIADQIRNAGGFESWKGQVLWYSVDGFSYPLASFDAVITDMSTEDAIATVKNRNAKNNFMPAGAFITYGKNQGEEDDITGEDEEDKAVRELQGDEKAFKILKIKIENQEEKPEWIPFQINSGDKLFSYSESSCQQNIGKIFGQPPVLRYELTPGKLGTAQEINDAYNFYNKMTELERQTLGDVLTQLTGFDCTIQQLVYAG